MSCTIQEITDLMISNAKKFQLNFSHKKVTRWNLWLSGPGITLSLTLNNSLMILSIQGVRKETISKFYNTCPNDVNDWILLGINRYLKVSKEILEEIKDKKESALYIEGEEDYMRYNRLHDEFLTLEEYRMMYPEGTSEIIIREEPEPIKVKRKVKKKTYEIPGQLSLFDMED